MILSSGVRAGTVSDAAARTAAAEPAAPAHLPPASGPSQNGQTPSPNGQSANGELYFQRCRWCQTPAYRRSLCPTCASTDMEWERSEGTGVILRRNPPMAQNRSVVAMAEGFTVICRVIGAPPEAVSPGAQVRIAPAVDPNRQDLPVVELCDPPVNVAYDAR